MWRELIFIYSFSQTIRTIDFAEHEYVYNKCNMYMICVNWDNRAILFCVPDDMARYSYKAQPEICKWNLIKLAEALADILPLAKSRALLEDVYVCPFMK